MSFRNFLKVFIFILILAGCRSAAKIDNTQTNQIVNIGLNDIGIMPKVTDGFIRLVLNEQLGSFSLSYVPNAFDSLYEPLFTSRNPRSSYMALSVNGRIHRLGISNIFNTRIERHDGDPALVFESPTLRLSQAFSPIKTGNFQNVNGMKITITIENMSEYAALIGLKFLIDTELGERKGMAPFVTEKRTISAETVIDRFSGERYWMSRGEIISLMGSIANPLDNNARLPDFIHFANWKRLDDTPWKLKYVEGRSFNYFPYSINDSAVCYFYEPAEIHAGNSVSYTVILSTEDIPWYCPPEQDVVNVYLIADSSLRNFNILTLEEFALMEAMRNNEDPNTFVLKRVQEVLNLFVVGDIHLNEQDMTEIERIVTKYRN